MRQRLHWSSSSWRLHLWSFNFQHCVACGAPGETARMHQTDPNSQTASRGWNLKVMTHRRYHLKQQNWKRTPKRAERQCPHALSHLCMLRPCQHPNHLCMPVPWHIVTSPELERLFPQRVTLQFTAVDGGLSHLACRLSSARFYCQWFEKPAGQPRGSYTIRLKSQSCNWSSHAGSVL